MYSLLLLVEGYCIGKKVEYWKPTPGYADGLIGKALAFWTIVYSIRMRLSGRRRRICEKDWKGLVC